MNKKGNLKEFVDKIFNDIENAKTTIDLQSIYANLEIPKKYFLNEDKYPPIGFTIEKNEISSLGNKFTLSEKIKEKKHTPLEKLLLSILWKNGDFGKEQHIIEGILGQNSIKEKKSGLVFYQFGKRLNNPENQPIIDQHIIRAFLYHLNPKEDLLKMGQLSNKNAQEIESYILWITERKNHIKGNKKEILFSIDKILFAVGKYIKKTN